jgi:hypothetical protein
MTTYYKAVRPDGTDFFSGQVRWLPPVGEPLPEGGLIVRHPTATTPSFGDDAAYYLSVSTEPANCTSMQWPCRLARLEATDAAVWTPNATALPDKRAAVVWLVTAEVDAWQALGPQGREVAAIIDRVRMLTTDEWRQLTAAWGAAWGAVRGAARNAARNAAGDAARNAAWGAVRDAARNAAWGAVRDAAWGAAHDATLATLVRDLITPKQYDLLMAPWRTVIGDQA